MSPLEALTLIIEANLTKSAYNVTALKHNHDLYPSYKEVYNTFLHVCVMSLSNCVSHFQFNNSDLHFNYSIDTPARVYIYIVTLTHTYNK